MLSGRVATLSRRRRNAMRCDVSWLTSWYNQRRDASRLWRPDKNVDFPPIFRSFYRDARTSQRVANQIRAIATLWLRRNYIAIMSQCVVGRGYTFLFIEPLEDLLFVEWVKWGGRWCKIKWGEIRLIIIYYKLTITITKEQRGAKPFLNSFWLKIARYL